jgi:hypothetical protein
LGSNWVIFFSNSGRKIVTIMVSIGDVRLCKSCNVTNSDGQTSVVHSWCRLLINQPHSFYCGCFLRVIILIKFPKIRMLLCRLYALRPISLNNFFGVGCINTRNRMAHTIKINFYRTIPTTAIRSRFGPSMLRRFPK